jgi:hypothetical protein
MTAPELAALTAAARDAREARRAMIDAVRDAIRADVDLPDISTALIRGAAGDPPTAYVAGQLVADAMMAADDPVGAGTIADVADAMMAATSEEGVMPE